MLSQSKNILLSIAVWITNVCIAQNYSPLTIPDSLLKDANAVIRQSYTNAVIKPGSATYTIEETITILNSTAEDLADITIPYDKLRKIKSFNAELYDKLGNKEKQFDKRDAGDYSAFSNNLGDDTRQKHWNLKGASFPYTIHYKYEIEMLSLFYIQNWEPVTDAGVSIESATFHLTCKEVNVSNKTQLVKLLSNVGNEYTWELKGFKAIKPQPYLPNNYNFLPYAVFSAETFELYGVKGASKTWSDFGRFIYALNENRENLDDTNIPEIDQRLSTLKTNEEKIQLLYRYLQNNYRYVSIQLGIGGWQAQTAKYTFQQKFGDCKALVTLMKGLLKRAGIKSYMALVDANKNRIEPQPDFVHNQFNHVILCIPNKTDTIWLECTSHIDPYNYLGSFTEGRNVLVLDEHGGSITRTPTYTEKTNGCNASTSVKFAEDGSCRLSSYITFSGEKQDLLRTINNDSDKKKLELAVFLEMDLSNAKLLAFNIANIDSNSPKLAFTTSLSDNSTMKKMASRIMINPSLLDPFKGFNSKTENRSLPFNISEGVTYMDTITFELPAQYLPENFKADEHKEIISPFGAAAFSLLFNAANNQLILYRKGSLKEQVYSSSDYKAFRQFMLDAENIYSPNLVLKKTE